MFKEDAHIYSPAPFNFVAQKKAILNFQISFMSQKENGKMEKSEAYVYLYFLLGAVYGISLTVQVFPDINNFEKFFDHCASHVFLVSEKKNTKGKSL